MSLACPSLFRCTCFFFLLGCPLLPPFSPHCPVSASPNPACPQRSNLNSMSSLIPNAKSSCKTVISGKHFSPFSGNLVFGCILCLAQIIIKIFYRFGRSYVSTVITRPLETAEIAPQWPTPFLWALQGFTIFNELPSFSKFTRFTLKNVQISSFSWKM